MKWKALLEQLWKALLEKKVVKALLENKDSCEKLFSKTKTRIFQQRTHDLLNYHQGSWYHSPPLSWPSRPWLSWPWRSSHWFTYRWVLFLTPECQITNNTSASPLLLRLGKDPTENRVVDIPLLLCWSCLLPSSRPWNNIKSQILKHKIVQCKNWPVFFPYRANPCWIKSEIVSAPYRNENLKSFLKLPVSDLGVL